MLGNFLNILTLIGMALALLQYPFFQRAVFKLMMYLYPKSFRVKYMDEMCETFLDSIKYHVQDSGPLGGFVIVAKELFGITKGATGVRYDQIQKGIWHSVWPTLIKTLVFISLLAYYLGNLKLSSKQLKTLMDTIKIVNKAMEEGFKQGRANTL